MARFGGRDRAKPSDDLSGTLLTPATDDLSVEVDLRGIEPLTSCLPSTRSTN